jgi:hypothetical protein
VVPRSFRLRGTLLAWGSQPSGQLLDDPVAVLDEDVHVGVGGAVDVQTGDDSNRAFEGG